MRRGGTPPPDLPLPRTSIFKKPTGPSTRSSSRKSHHVARMRRADPPFGQASVGADVGSSSTPSRRSVRAYWQQLHVGDVVQSQRGQQEPAILGVRLKGDDRPDGPTNLEANSDSSQLHDVDRRHSRGAVLLEDGREMDLVGTREQPGSDGSIARRRTAPRRPPLQRTASSFPSCTEKAVGGDLCSIVPASADGRDPCQSPVAASSTSGAELSREVRVQQLHELVVGDASRSRSGMVPPSS